MTNLSLYREKLLIYKTHISQVKYDFRKNSFEPTELVEL